MSSPIFSKRSLERAIRSMKHSLESTTGCEHPRATRLEDDGIVYFHCKDCNMSFAVHPDQEAAWKGERP